MGATRVVAKNDNVCDLMLTPLLGVNHPIEAGDLPDLAKKRGSSSTSCQRLRELVREVLSQPKPDIHNLLTKTFIQSTRFN